MLYCMGTTCADSLVTLNPPCNSKATLWIWWAWRVGYVPARGDGRSAIPRSDRQHECARRLSDAIGTATRRCLRKVSTPIPRHTSPRPGPRRRARAHLSHPRPTCRRGVHLVSPHAAAPPPRAKVHPPQRLWIDIHVASYLDGGVAVIHSPFPFTGPFECSRS